MYSTSSYDALTDFYLSSLGDSTTMRKLYNFQSRDFLAGFYQPHFCQSTNPCQKPNQRQKSNMVKLAFLYFKIWKYWIFRMMQTNFSPCLWQNQRWLRYGARPFVCVLLWLFCIPGHTQEQLPPQALHSQTAMHFDLPGQALSSALIEFAVQAEISIFVPKHLVLSYQSSPVIGRFNIENALLLLLAKTPLTFAYTKESQSIV